MANKCELHWYASQDHTNADPFRTLFNTASSEKEDLMCLNDRLADVFCRLENTPKEGFSMDYSSFLHAIRCLQEEIKKLKAAYETELSKLRRENELSISERNELVAAAEMCKSKRESLYMKLDDVVKEKQVITDQVTYLKTYVSQKEKEIIEFTSLLQTIRSENELLKPKILKYEQDSDIFRKQWECERRLRQEQEDRNSQLVDKLNFEARIHEQQVRDLNERLCNALAIIESLTAKLKDSDGGGGTDKCNLNTMLQKVREQMVQEFVKYKKETEETVNKTICEMRDRLEKRAREKQQLEEERDRLTVLTSKFQLQVNELEGKLTTYSYSNQQMQSALCNEKTYSAKCIRDLEHKLMEAQDTLMQKVREVAAAREMQTTLRTEIESYKAILECQERKLHDSCQKLPNIQQGSGVRHQSHVTQGFLSKTGCAGGQTSASCCPPGGKASSTYVSCRAPPITSTGKTMPTLKRCI